MAANIFHPCSGNGRPVRAGIKSSMVMLLAIVGAPLGGYLVDRWRKRRINARLIFPAITTLISAIIMFFAFNVFGGKLQYLLLLSVGISITAFVSAASAVTQDVVHAGLRAISYAVAVVVQNLLGGFLAPLVMGAISDATNIQTAFNLLPISLVGFSGIVFCRLLFLCQRPVEGNGHKTGSGVGIGLGCRLSVKASGLVRLCRLIEA